MGLTLCTASWRWRAEPKAIVHGDAVPEQHVRRKKRYVRRASGIRIPIDLQTAVVYVIILGTGSSPRNLMVTETAPEWHLPDVVSNSYDWIQIEVRRHARLPQVTAKQIGKGRNGIGAVGAVYLFAEPRAAVQPVDHLGEIVGGPAIHGGT